MRFFPLILLVCASFLSQAQIALSVADAATQNITPDRLDLVYPPAISTDSTSVFSNDQHAYFTAYFDMIRSLNTYLNDHDFMWGSATKCYQFIYFNEEGIIDFFLYEFDDDKIELSRLNEFEQLVNEFIVTYEFPISKNEKFSQCSPVNLRDVL